MGLHTQPRLENSKHVLSPFTKNIAKWPTKKSGACKRNKCTLVSKKRDIGGTVKYRQTQHF